MLRSKSVVPSPGHKKKWLAIAVANHLSDRVTTSPGTDFSLCYRYAVNELPQPQLRSAFGF
jgi:hypothetical protein